MCGIGGYFGIESDQALAILEEINSCHEHRGPDSQGVFTEGSVGLAHRRLSIIDHETGQQPMRSGCGRYVIAYNGECYNYLELKGELEADGVRFTTDSDTEVVLEAFARWGADAFDRMNGMWGLAIWDTQKEQLTLSRDHFGIKPLYIADLSDDNGAKLIFSSEIKGIVGTGLVERKANERTLYRYLKFRIHEDSADTFFDGITRLMPGEMLTIDAGGTHKCSYTTMVNELRDAAKLNRQLDDDAVAEYKERLTASVRDRLQSDVPVGTSLSGGLDSTTVALLINEMLGRGETENTQAVGSLQNTFSAVFPGSRNDEERYVDDAIAAAAGRINAHKVYPSADQFKQDLVDFVRTQEEPTISTGPYAQYALMREAAKHVTVLLDGQGADEMMAGYIPYYFVYFRELKKQGRYKELAEEVARSADVLARLGRFKAKSALKRRKHVGITDLLSREFTDAHRGETFTVVSDDLKERLIEDLFHNSLPSLLRYEDRNTMRYSLEGRVPFLDRDTVTFLFSLSNKAIINAGWNKYVLREAVEGVIPDSIRLRRNKIGFTTPENEWFVRLKGTIFSILSSESFGRRPWFNQAEVLKAFEDYLNNRNDAGTMVFWRLVNVELWARIYLDSDDLGSELDYQIRDADVSEHGKNAPADPHTPLEANAGKELDVSLPGGGFARRYPVQTEKFSEKSDMDAEITRYVGRFFANLEVQGDADDREATDGKRWSVAISEKIIAIMQGRSWFVWDIHPGVPAKVLSKFVVRTPAGIGLGDPTTMQLAIKEAGLPRIAYAAAGAAIGKVRGKRGVFYELAGANVRAIDGPTEYSVYPSNVSAKLPPSKPEFVARHLASVIRDAVPERWRDSFDGVAIIDANDLGCNVLGRASERDDDFFGACFVDNPLGQGRQQTPIAVIFER